MSFFGIAGMVVFLFGVSVCIIANKDRDFDMLSIGKFFAAVGALFMMISFALDLVKALAH